jgi:NAD(P)-dependent dehydrogenase (short-subunit alcohol dehydrogenase family)
LGDSAEVIDRPLEAAADQRQAARPLDGRVALVTGAGRGLGEAIADALAGAGASVVVADVREDAARDVAVRLERSGATASALALDVSDEEQARAAVETVEREYGGLDVLVNNAGIDVTLPVVELSVHDWDRVLAVNLRGPLLMSKFALERMQRRKRGHIVNIVSTAAKRAWPNAAPYHASKWGLLGLSHALHAEARQHGVKVTAVIAGGMRTAFLLDRFPDIDASTLQDPRNVARTVCFVLTLPDETVIPEVMVLPMKETSWP